MNNVAHSFCFTDAEKYVAKGTVLAHVERLWMQGSADGPHGKPRFIAVTSLEDVQAIRTVAFHPDGNLFVIGANSKTVRICHFPTIADLRWIRHCMSCCL